MLSVLPLKPNRKRKKYRLGNAFPLPRIQDVPLIDFELDENPIEDQTLKADTLDDMCTAYALTSVLEPQEGVQLDPGYSFAKGKQREGRYDTFGLDLDDIGMTAIKWGALPLSKSPFPDKPRSFVANWKNWPALYDHYAKEHKQAAMLWVKGPYDTFDNIRASLWLLKNLPEPRRRAGIMAGAYWHFETGEDGVVRRYLGGKDVGHAFRIRGQQMVNGVPHLLVQNSYGTGNGFRGLYYFPREIVNQTFAPYGQAIFVDMTSEELEKIEHRFIAILKSFVRLLTGQLEDITPKPIPAETPVEPKPTPEPMPEETLQDMARRVCKEVGLTTNMTRDLMATIHGESGWNPRARGINYKKGTKIVLSTDWGLCQFNDAKNAKGVPYWIGPGAAFSSVDEVLSNPEKCVRVMCQTWKRGRARDWSAFRFGHYKQYLHLY